MYIEPHLAAADLFGILKLLHKFHRRRTLGQAVRQRVHQSFLDVVGRTRSEEKNNSNHGLLSAMGMQVYT